MVAADFQKIVDVVLGFEGGYQADPKDPGNWTGRAVGSGELVGTNFGISAAYNPNVDIKALTREDAANILKNTVWTPLDAAPLPGPLSLLVFDFAVNSGLEEAAEALQRVVHVEIDGKIGDDTVTAVYKAVTSEGPDLFDLCAAYQAERLIHLASKESWKDDVGGLAKRLCSGLATAIEWLSQSEGKITHA